MRDMPSKRVMVGVEDLGCDAALQFAAAEARRNRCGIHLVHVAPAYVAPQQLMELTSVALGIHRPGEMVLAEAHERLVRMLGSDADAISVSTELCHSAVIPALVAAAAHARVLVLQHRGMGPDGHPRALSVTLGVVARTRAAVLAVPDTWRPEPSVGTGVVTVGVVDATSSSGVVRIALGEADRMGARVRLLHAGDLPDPDLERELEAGFAPVCRERPRVPVEVEVVPEPPELALVERARESSLIVVGRRHSRMPMAPRLGHVVRAALRRSTCPVLVVDPGPPIVPEPRGLASVAVH
jgi:nucleotide-binding universal stress UspA family protein